MRTWSTSGWAGEGEGDEDGAGGGPPRAAVQSGAAAWRNNRAGGRGGTLDATAPGTMPVAVALASILLLVVVLVEVFEVMLLPRRVRRRRFVRLYFRWSWAAWRALAERMPRRRRVGTLGVFGPLSMIGLLVVWTWLLVAGFGALQWALARGADDPPSLLNQLYFSGVTFFTLGYGDVTAATRLGKVVAVLEAGIGFGFIAVVIGYLPVLYQLFSRREAHVIRLDARAGSPPTAGALVERHVGTQGLAALGELLSEWEQWSAELLESQLSYPMLAYYRSQHDNESWLAALAAILDVSALLMVGVERADLQPAGGGAWGDERDADDGVPRFQARMTFAGARLALVEMTRVLADPLPGEVPADRLPAASFPALVERLAEAGLRLRDPAGAPGALAHLRATYEPHLHALGARLALPIPPWMRSSDAPDNWERDAPAARALYEAAEARERREG